MNDALRRGLNLACHQDEDEPFQVEAHDFGFKRESTWTASTSWSTSSKPKKSPRDIRFDHPDVNLLIHAYNAASPRHQRAKQWWEELMDDPKAIVGLTWVAMMGFIRVVTHPRHAQIFFGLLESLGSAGNLTTDAHLAAVAIEFQAELHTTDADMSRFSGLSWRNPIG
ncbi:MAG: hypothetical protein AB7S38_15205 [Vulcanimicrobiota bacterium]